MAKSKYLVFVSVFSLLFGVFVVGFSHQGVKAEEERPMGTAFYESFDVLDDERWSKAGVWTNGQMFNATWYPEQVTLSDGQMRLTIDKEDEQVLENDEQAPPYKAGELRTNDFYQYGLFEVSMKPAKAEGTVSSFFTYTGEWDWDGDPWDEIDIEFLGKDTTRIQFNYFTNGVGGNEFYYDLGFDASESFNTYAFEWREDSITWYVNGEAVHTATENIPQTPQKIMMNLWPGVGVDEWTGVFDGDNTPLHADYEWVRYTPLEALDEEESGDDNEEEPVEEVEEPAEDEEVSVRPIGSAIYETFNTFNGDIWSIAHGWTNGQMFNATWYDSQITFSNGIMRFAIDKEDDEEAHPPYKAAELRTNDFYHYGLFEVSMKPAKAEGTVSSFFTYTGEWDWDGDPWDEIDIEFLGKDTTRIQFNYFTNGVGGNEFYYDLGFDASESFNTYAFEWREDSITWYVNGEAVHTATENIPQTPQKIMMNLWPGVGVDEWTGVFDGDNTPVYSYYDWVRYTPLSELSDPPVTPEPPMEEPKEEPIEEPMEEPIEKIEIDENNETEENENDLKESGGERLPNTATSMYHYLLFGLLAFAIGVMVYLRARVTEK